jgi:penicillin-binding protein 1A
MRRQAPVRPPLDPPAAPPPEPPRQSASRGARRRRRGGGLLALAFWTLATFAVVTAGGVFWVLHLADAMPETAWVDRGPRRPVIVVLDREGREVARRGPQQNPQIELARLPDYLAAAVLAVEDRRFYEHGGVDVRGLARAALENLRAGRVVQGGSTLTQQLAKNTFLDSERTFSRKIREMLLAYWIEGAYSKDEILELYLNRVYFGAGAWGVEAAARRYFGKSAADLSLGEAALLAGLLKAPSRDSPTSDVARAEARATVVLEVMAETGAITPAELDAALAEPVRVLARARAEPVVAGWFVDWVVADAQAATGGGVRDLVIRTTLDLDAQRAAERAVEAALAAAGDSGAEQAALVALDGDGAVRAMVGGRVYADSQFNRAIQARRQPGSAFKPFVYAAAIEAGLSPWDVRSDAPIALGDWSPANYDEEFQGDMALIDALAESVNTVAVRVAEEIGRERIVRLVKRLGMTSRIRPTRAMALGSHEVTPIELTAAYAAFANGGYTVRPYAVAAVEAVDGRTLWTRPAPAIARGLDARTTRLMNVMLARVVTDGTGRAAALSGRPAAGKTGTSNDFRDAWFIGFVPGFAAGVWVGADDGAPMARMTGGALPARIWREFMTAALDGEPVTPLDAVVEPADRTQTPAPVVAEEPQGSGLAAGARAELDDLLARLEEF